MASRGTTFAKQDRDRAKKARAAEKRERRESRQTKPDEAEVELPAAGEEIPAADLLRLVEQLHEDFAAKRIDFEEFEERKAELMSRISV
jgi:hypothetical protein